MKSALRGLPVPPPLPGEETFWAEALDDWWWLDRHNLSPEQVERLPAASIARIKMITIEAEKLRNEDAKRV